jgi:malate dehydrogenase
MKIAIIGASGDVGRTVILSLIQRGLLKPADRLQLVGRSEGPSFRTLYGLKSDILDGLMESAPHMDVIIHPSEIDGEIIVMAAGITFPRDVDKKLSRESLQAANAKICQLYASAISKSGKSPIILVTTNPVEAGVKVFTNYFPKNQVMGMGVHMDTMRFRREIAEALGIDRNRIRALVVGEHGPEMIQLWSSVHIEGMDEEEQKKMIEELSSHPREVAWSNTYEAWEKTLSLLKEEGPTRAFEHIHGLPLEMRTQVRPWTAHYTGSKTTIGPAMATVDLLEKIILDKKDLVSCQINLQGEFYGLKGIFGTPVVLGKKGVEEIREIGLWAEERDLLNGACQNINKRLKGV